MSENKGFDDPLSGLAFAGQDEDLDEEIPFDDPPQNPPQTQAGFLDSDPTSKQPLLHDSQQQGTSQSQNDIYPSQSSKQHPSDQYATTRLDTLASYGQLVTPPHDTPQPSHPEIQPQRGMDASEAGPSTGAAFPQVAESRRQPNITITDPIKHSEKSMMPGVSGSYVTYAVNSRMTLPKFSTRGASVRRRFRDFVALAELLKVMHRGYFIPPRPEKNPVEGQRATDDFVELRRHALEKYLIQLALHPAIAQSDELLVFLEAEAPLGSNLQWQQLQPMHGSILEGVSRLPKQLFGQDPAAPSPTEAATNTKHTSDLLRRFKELTVKEPKDPAGLDQPEIDLRNEKLMVDEFLEKVAAASRKAEKLVSKFEQMGAVTGDLGLSTLALAKFEDTDGSSCGTYTDSAMASKNISADAKRVGSAAVRVSRLSRTATSSVTEALSPLHDNLALAPAAIKALKEREAALLTLHAIEADLEKRRHAVALLDSEAQKTPGGVDKAKGRKADNLRNEVAGLEAAVQAASQEYDRVKSRNTQEVSRWKESRVQDFNGMLDHFARIMAAYEDRRLSVWLEVAEQFGVTKAAAARLTST
ncbi:hypothetical protein ABBQ38_001750 [Trebouxia sp. C0009 RCD-2024]